MKLLDAKITAYAKTSGPSAESSKADVERFLTKMGIRTYVWKVLSRYGDISQNLLPVKDRDIAYAKNRILASYDS